MKDHINPKQTIKRIMSVEEQGFKQVSGISCKCGNKILEFIGENEHSGKVCYYCKECGRSMVVQRTLSSGVAE